MANLLQVPSMTIGLMGRRPQAGGGNLLQQLLMQNQAQFDAGDAYFTNPQARPAGPGVPTLQGDQVVNVPAPQQPGQRERVSGWRVLDRVLGGETITGGLDAERARLQAEADAPARAAIAEENERIARALGPQALLALRTNPQAIGEGLAAQYKPTTTAAGGISTIFGTGQQVSAPRDFEAGTGIYRADPLGGVERVADLDPSYGERAALARAEQDAVQAERRFDIDERRLAQDDRQFDERLGFDRSRQEAKPLSAAQSRQLETYLGEIESLTALNGELDRMDQLIASDALNLGPWTNFVSGARNRLGASDENSRNFAEFKATVQKVVNDSLRLNKGTQTEGDAQRAATEILANPNDEGVVRTQLARLRALNERAAQFRQGRVQALESGQYIGGSQGGGSGSVAQPTSAAEYQALPSGTLFMAPDGTTRRKP